MNIMMRILYFYKQIDMKNLLVDSYLLLSLLPFGDKIWKQFTTYVSKRKELSV